MILICDFLFFLLPAIIIFVNLHASGMCGEVRKAVRTFAEWKFSLNL